MWLNTRNLLSKKKKLAEKKLAEHDYAKKISPPRIEQSSQYTRIEQSSRMGEIDERVRLFPLITFVSHSEPLIEYIFRQF